MAKLEGLVRKVQDKFGMRPTLPLGSHVRIGAIGRIGPDGEWQPVSTTTSRFGVKPTGVDHSRDERGVWDATSGKEVKFHAYAKGQTSKLISNVADAKARTEIEFGSAKSFAFAAKGVRIDQATNVDEVLRAIRRAYHRRADLPENKRWDRELCFVFGVAGADRLTVLAAKQAHTEVVVTGKGKVGPPQSAADLAASVEVGISSNELTRAQQAPAPKGSFYRAYKLNPSVLRQWDRERSEEIGTERDIGFYDRLGSEVPSKTELERVLEARPLPDFDEAFKPV
jgi:hypothetical protein